MSPACPKCSYVRKETDEAPAWQCPKCGIAIAKYIALQKGAAEREAARRAPAPVPPQREVFQPESFRMFDEMASPFFQKLGAWILALISATLIHYMFFPHDTEESDPPEPPAVTRQIGSPRPLVAPEPSGPVLPADSLKDFFESAHREGSVDGITMITAEIKGIPRLDRVKPVSVHVERREALPSANCDRFGVTLTQGGGARANRRGETVMTPYSMHFVYSLDYCLDGTQPAAGRNVRVEAQH